MKANARVLDFGDCLRIKLTPETPEDQDLLQRAVRWSLTYDIALDADSDQAHAAIVDIFDPDVAYHQAAPHDPESDDEP